MSPYNQLANIILGQSSDGTDGSSTVDPGQAGGKDYFAELFDNPIRIFLIVNNLVGAITTFAVEDKSSLDVVSIMRKALSKITPKVSSPLESRRPALQQTADDLAEANAYITKIGYVVDAFRFSSIATLLFGLLTLLKSPSSFGDQLGLYASLTLTFGIISTLLYITNIVLLNVFANIVGELA